jgi:light-regulated signal transduction histidine kinase (bacteriophytochrome)
MVMTPTDILIVDDSEDDREAIARQLNRVPHLDIRLHEAEDGAECLAKLQDGRSFGCVLLDYSLPGQDGIRVLHQILAVEPTLPVIMITGQGNEDVAVEAMKIGAYDYLVKQDIHVDLVGRTISNAMQRARMARRLNEQQESLAEFARVLVHDLRAPLRSIRMRSEMLRESLPPETVEESSGHLDAMHKATDRLDRLIQSLQRYTEADVDTGDWTGVELTSVVDAVQSALTPGLQEAGASMTAQADLPTVHGDEPQLVQLIQNLVANGIKYNQSAAPAVHVKADVTDDGITIQVSDNGIGIDAKHHERIFEPFKRLHGRAAYAGTGLGLATCTKIVERHAGRIWCSSEPGEGATFHVFLPTEK